MSVPKNGVLRPDQTRGFRKDSGLPSPGSVAEHAFRGHQRWNPAAAEELRPETAAVRLAVPRRTLGSLHSGTETHCKADSHSGSSG